MRAAEPEQYMGLFVVIGFSRVRLPKRLRLSTVCFMPEVLRLVVWERYSEAAVPFLSAFRNADIAAHESVKRLLGNYYGHFAGFYKKTAKLVSFKAFVIRDSFP